MSFLFSDERTGRCGVCNHNYCEVLEDYFDYNAWADCLRKGKNIQNCQGKFVLCGAFSKLGSGRGYNPGCCKKLTQEECQAFGLDPNDGEWHQAYPIRIEYVVNIVNMDSESETEFEKIFEDYFDYIDNVINKEYELNGIETIDEYECINIPIPQEVVDTSIQRFIDDTGDKYKINPIIDLAKVENEDLLHECEIGIIGTCTNCNQRHMCKIWGD